MDLNIQRKKYEKSQIGKGIKVENFKVDKHLRVGHLGRLAA